MVGSYDQRVHTRLLVTGKLSTFCKPSNELFTGTHRTHKLEGHKKKKVVRYKHTSADRQTAAAGDWRADHSADIPRPQSSPSPPRL